MDQNERQVIEGLFGKLRQVEQQAPERDPEAESYIRQQVTANPGAPYYMAQAMLVQEQALASLQGRLQQLERERDERPTGGGSFLSGLFGGGQSAPQRPAARGMTANQPFPGQVAGHGGNGAPWGGQGGVQGGSWGAQGGAFGGRPGGGGFLAGAMQTAVGVAGGMLVASALSDAFSGGEEAIGGIADEAGNVADEVTAPFEDPGMEDAAATEDFDAGGFDESA